MHVDEQLVSISIAKACRLFSYTLEKAFQVSKREESQFLTKDKREDLSDVIEHAHLQLDRLYFLYLGRAVLRNDDAQRPKLHLVKSSRTPP